MKSYNVSNYIKYKQDLNRSMPDDEIDYAALTRDQLIVKFLPLVENLARKFSTTQQASGVLSINDLIQEGSVGLVAAVDRVNWTKLLESDDIEKTIKSFFSKRIKGAIRRAVDINRGSIRIPEHKLNEIRKDFGKNKQMVEMFFNSIFLSIDAKPNQDENMAYQIADNSEPYNKELLNMYLIGLLKKNLNEREYNVLRLSYGLDCDKHSAKQIAEQLDIKGTSAYVRVSQLKRQAIEKLIDNVDHSQVLDYL
jgi:RNA polymerase sigma factor (sigma-70 family)|tara:strand:+ start:5622 stop:6377 length:756 start_codon:yes stop_codon:yes gene_type:complete